MKDSYVVRPGWKPTIVKTASSEKVYGSELADILDDGDSVASVTCTPDGVNVIGSPAYTSTVVKAKFAGGTPGQIASARFDFTTALGTKDSVTIYFQIIEG